MVALLMCLAAASARAQFFPQTVQVPMDDGVTLATDVWRNFLDGTPRPVLLRRTPYGRALDAGTVSALLSAGFIVVSQDVRGRGDSAGTFLPFFNDKEDGRATIDWIAAQGWSSGRVATYSSSAEGIVQYMAMAAAPNALACAHIALATPDLYQALFPGGAWFGDLGTSWLKALGASSVIDTFEAHEVHDDYWSAATLEKAQMATIDHPVFMVGGFFDIFAVSEHEAAQALQQNVAPSSRGDVYVVMGPWTHGGFGSSRQGQLLLPDEAAMPAYSTDFAQYLSWCLLGAARPPYATVRYFVTELSDATTTDTTDNSTRLVAKGEWHDDTVWPPAAVTMRSLYLQDDHQLGEKASAQPVPLAIDPANPTPSVGGGNFVSSAGPYDQAAVDARADVYTATTQPMAGDTVLVGAPHATIWAASATDDVDVVVRVELVTPGGKAMLFTDGIQRGRFVAGDQAIHPLTPGQPVPFEVTLGPLAVRLPAGHALRIGISGASTPRYDLNPNSAQPLSSHPTAQPTTLTIYRDAQHPSRIDLPLLSGAVPGAQLLASPPAGAMDGGVSTIGGDAGADVRADAQVPTHALDAGGSVADDADGGTDDAHHASGCSCSATPRAPNVSEWLSWSVVALYLLLRRTQSRLQPRS